MRALWWLKRDLRLSDNHPLSAAVDLIEAEQGELLPVYVFEPSILSAPDSGDLHVAALLPALRTLRADLQARGGELLVLRGELPAVFEELRGSLPFQAIYAEEETGTAATFERDRRVRRWASEVGVRLTEQPHNGVVRGLTDRDRRMTIWRRRMEEEPLSAPATIPMSADTARRCAVSRLPTAEELGFKPPVGAVQRVDEPSANRVLESFLYSRAVNYRKGISSPSLSRNSGSRLSVHLAWGTISLRSVLHRLDQRVEELRALRKRRPVPEEAKGRLKPLSSFRSRLYWHDHFCQRLEREPEMEFEPLNRAYADLPYDAGSEIEAALWAGRTGFPMVDATVRSLTETGFVNFRMRAMLVSFATYALHIDWRKLRDPMARIMADYLPGIHISQLQMQAGVVGINSVRVYNPTKQLLDNDPDCAFVRRFLPELRPLSCEQIIALAVHGVDSPSHGKSGRAAAPAGAGQSQLPFDEPGPDRSTAAGSPMDYPPPIVDFRAAVKEMQSGVYKRKASPFGKEEATRVLEKHGSRRR